MKLRKYLFIVFTLILFFSCKEVYAFDSSNYQYKSLCDTYEVAGFHGDGYIDPVACFSNFYDAQLFMRTNGAIDLGLMTKVNGLTKIIDANNALVDLTVNSGDLTYFYESSEMNGRKYTYMYGGANYGGVDAGFMGGEYSYSTGQWTAKVRIANFTGWIPQDTYEIVPITWVKSYSYYTVTNESIIHTYVRKIQNDFSTTESNAIGPKPDMLSPGRYYSYDGHYFYDNLTTMLGDYRANVYNSSVNKNNVYYNYYMYLSAHTKTTYSSQNIDEYIRNNLGYKKDVYGNTASPGTSRLYGSGDFFYYAQEKYGVNALLALNLGRNESGNGRSYLAINKNNGFGLDAVDSNPIGGAKWFPTFSYNILVLASKWITYGYAHPRDWRYFGPQFGDKWIGMNVKYASAAYWSETMANLYYTMDRAMGLQDYNYYQLGVLKKQAYAYYEPDAHAEYYRYTYPEAEDAVVIVDEVYSNGEVWYKLVSDLNMDNYHNEITGDYNWNNYVYVQASLIKKINTAKNGYVYPTNVTEYQNKNYTYDLHVVDGEFRPNVGQSTKDTAYHYDSALTSQTGETLLKDRYVIIYAEAFLNNQPVSYLVSSDYRYSQKHWVSADSIKKVNLPYGKVSVVSDNNTYTLVNYNTVDSMSTAIGGLYDYAYIPILSSVEVDGELWYKVPVSLTTNSNIYGYTLAKWSDVVSIAVSQTVVANTKPTITASDKELFVGDEFDATKDVTAYDQEDGDLTSSVTVASNNVDTTKAGTYKVKYQVSDSQQLTNTLEITVVVKENNAPVINAEDKAVTINTTFNELEGVTATDAEDGDLTTSITVKENTVNLAKLGTYKVVYEVTDSRGKTTTKEISVEIVKDRDPVINAEDKQVVINNTFDPLSGVTATDAEDGDITSSITVTNNTVDTTTLGTYTITYQVKDSADNTVTKTINVEVINYIEKNGEFFLNGLKWNESSKKYEINGFLIINETNNYNKTYKLLLTNKTTETDYIINISKWTENTPYNIGTENNYDYNDSWFKDKIDLSDIPNGDYDLYMLAYTDECYTKTLLNNYFNTSITRRAATSQKGYTFKVQQLTKNKAIELYVRDSVLTTQDPPTTRNMVNGYDEITFNDKKLYMLGYSYDIGGIYDDENKVTKKLVLENQETYEQTIYDLNNSKGLFKIETLDKKDKTNVWFENEIDISNLNKGTYTIYIYTKTSNAENYDELPDIFSYINVSTEIDGKTYTVKYNQERHNRLEITVE